MNDAGLKNAKDYLAKIWARSDRGPETRAAVWIAIGHICSLRPELSEQVVELAKDDKITRAVNLVMKAGEVA